MAVVYDPSTTSAAHRLMAPRLLDLRAVWGGTQTLRERREAYLPRFPKESDTAWDYRWKSARLRRNMFRQSVERITGRIFEVPTKLNPPKGATALPAQGEVFADDADQRGNSLDRLARRLYVGALKLGLSYAFVDYPVVQARNLAEERALDARPYVVVLEPEQVLRCYEDDNGRVSHLAWRTLTTEWDEALGAQVVQERIHERFPGRWVTWRRVAAQPSIVPTNMGGRLPDANWTIEGQGTVSQQRIMLHALYAEKEDVGLGRTPLTEVADLTLEHFQIASDYRNILTQVMFPIMFATGVDTKKIGSEPIGPDTILGSDKADAKFGYLEHTGKAVEAGYKDLESLEQRAEAYAGQLTRPSGDVKATQTAVSTAEVSSFAKDLAQSLQDVLQAVCDDAALWYGVESIGRPEVNMDFAVDLPDGDLQALKDARSGGDLSRPTYWRELSRRNVLARDFDADEESRLLEDEEAEGMAREQEAMRFAAGLKADEGAGAPREPKEPDDVPPGTAA